MLLKIKLSLALVCMVILFSGCGAKSYVDKKYEDSPSQKVVVSTIPYEVQIIVEFQRNGEHFAVVDKQLNDNVVQAFKLSGIISTDSNTKPSVKVICNNVANIGTAVGKGVLTGLTLGLAGSAVSDYYQIHIEYTDGDIVVKKEYNHAIHSTIGNASSPYPNAEPVSPTVAFNGVIEDVILEFIADMRNRNIFSINP